MRNAIGNITKNHKIEIRVTKQQKELIHSAAKKRNLKPTVWVLSILLEEANRINGADDI